MEGAIRSYRRALARNPLNTVAQQELNKLLYRLGRDDEFLISLDDAAKKSPTSIAPLLLKGDFLCKTGEFSKAAEEYEAAVRLVPEAALPHDMLGTIYARQGRFDEAVRSHERAVERARTAAAFLPVIDNLELALNHAGSDPGAIVEGVRAVRDQAVSILERLGYERHAETGVPFDPARHEVVGVVQDPDAEPNTVVQTLQKGYLLHDRVIRPALVIVAKPRTAES